MTKNIVQFRAGFVNLPSGKQKNQALAMTVVSELMQFGFLLDTDAIKNLSQATKANIVAFHDEVVPWVKKMVGATRSYRPFWKGFPDEVMEKSEVELWVHQIVHYMSNGTYEPNEWTKTRKTAFEQPKYTTVTVGTDKDFDAIFTKMVGSNQSLTPEDLMTVKWFVESKQSLVMPAVVPFKETLCTLASLGVAVPVKTTTDVLRIAVALSGGDISLPAVPPALAKSNAWSSVLSANPEREKFKFKKFSRSQRRYILGLLEKTNCDAGEAVLKDQRWIRLGEVIHPGEYAKQYPKSFKMFKKLRNDKVQSFYGKVDASFQTGFTDGLRVLSERPGELARRMDALIRKDEDTKSVLYVFDSVAAKVSNKVLFEMWGHFAKRNAPVVNRSVMIKGARKRTKLPDLPAIKEKDIKAVQKSVSKALMAKFAQLDALGKVWIDPELKKIPLPTNMRSMNAALRPTVRGSRIPIGNQDAKVIRAFVHWFDENGSRDIDLTGTFIGMGKSERIGWNGTHKSHIGCYSGDVRHRQGACAEYIDIDVAQTLKAGFKYVIIDARNYNGGSFAEITDCVFGYMERENASVNHAFVPATLNNTVQLTSQASTTIVAVIDVETREYIFLDIDQGGIPVASANFTEIMEAIKPYCEPPAFSVYHLLDMHVKAREGKHVDEKSADTLFKFEDFSSSYVNTLQYMGV